MGRGLVFGLRFLDSADLRVALLLRTSIEGELLRDNCMRVTCWRVPLGGPDVPGVLCGGSFCFQDVPNVTRMSLGRF